VTSSKPTLRLHDESAPASQSAFGSQYDSKQRLRIVLDVAAKRFEADGFHGTSLQQIATDVGVTKAAIYHYVDSKEQLLFLIHDAFVSSMIDSAERYLEEARTPADQLRFFVLNIFETVAEYRPYVKAFFRDYGVLNETLHAELREKRRRYEGLVTTAIRQGIDSGEFAPDLDESQATLFLFGACNWSYQWLPSGDMQAAKARADEWLRMLLKAFAK
jgi:AcrR family transcriptional regulator